MANSLEVAAQAGDTKAIEALMNKAFASKGILVRVTNSGSTLKILLRNATYPKQQICDAVKRGIDKIHPVGFDQVSLNAERTSSTAPWHEQWPLSSPNVVRLDQVSEYGDAEQVSDARTVNAAIDTENNNTRPKWYQQTWLIVLLLLLFPVVGIALVWISPWAKRNKWTATAISGVWLCFALLLSPEQSGQPLAEEPSHTTNATNEKTELPSSDIEEQPSTAPDESRAEAPAGVEEPTEEPTRESEKLPELTPAQKFSLYSVALSQVDPNRTLILDIANPAEDTATVTVDITAWDSLSMEEQKDFLLSWYRSWVNVYGADARLEIKVQNEYGAYWVAGSNRNGAPDDLILER